MKNILIIGAGFSGAVIAEQLSKTNRYKIHIVDERNHAGGNCHTERDRTGIMIHKYGPHIFNTDNQKVWDYVNQFGELVPFINRVKSKFKDQVYSLPINLHTINQYFMKSLNPQEARNFIGQLADTSIDEPKNFQEQALKFLGRELYEAFFYGYTKKQWGCEPSVLPASILKRLPVRFNYNDNYYNTYLQGIPRHGYTSIIEKMLDHVNINLQLNVKFDFEYDISVYDHVFYTGPVDAFFNYIFGRLSYRTVYFERTEDTGDFQGNAVINYAEAEIPYTRVHEHKHFTPWESHEKTVYFKEFSKETEEGDVPYYPKRLEEDLLLYEKYKAQAELMDKYTFLGRLATYRYMDMHHVIGEALDIASRFLISESNTFSENI